MTTRISQVYEMLLIGDSGNIKRHQPDEIMELMKSHLSSEENSAVVFLGDNIYPKGLPPEGSRHRKDAEKVLEIYQQSLEAYKGQVLFISGNHDWNKGRSDGIEYVLRQEKYLHKLFPDRFQYVPPQGCPGPFLTIDHENFCLIAINTQWWVQSGFRPVGKQNGCTVETEEQFYEQLEGLMKKNRHKRIVIMGHYPIYSYSLHGGKYKLKHHLFPFTLYKKRALLPIPVFGSLLPLYRKYIGAREDLSHPRFRRLRSRLKKMFIQYPGMIYLAGHEHNLQYIDRKHVHYIVSGAASKSTYVIDGRYAKFSHSAKGFFKLKFFSDQKVKAEVLVVDKHNPMGKLVYEGWIV